MWHGCILPGEERFNVLQWHNDHLPELHNDDALWGFTLRASEEVRINRIQGSLMDPVLLHLFNMGIDQWTSPDHRTNSSIQVMRHGTVMASRLLDRILILENEVRVSLVRLFCNLKSNFVGP